MVTKYIIFICTFCEIIRGKIFLQIYLFEMENVFISILPISIQGCFRTGDENTVEEAVACSLGEFRSIRLRPFRSGVVSTI